ncbi:MAG: stage IV sporulation protein A [Clostridia bacterium]|nr:stage IV sporulation protein A [Clostridia bacterium]
MLNYDIYDDIAKRTDGDVYFGVVGPVRTGKSTFIKRFMELFVLDKVEDKNKLLRMIDELPQSGDGKTIMTTEPKFVPNEAVKVTFDKMSARVRLIDCVGYVVDEAIGHREDDRPRLVKTPWSDDPMPFERAAEIGTDKVIRDHSTVAVMVTTDGTITDINRAKYVDAEERVVDELKRSGKPFVIVLNSKKPFETDAIRLKESLAERYSVPVILCDVLDMDKDIVQEIMKSLLFEFPITGIKVKLPKWMRSLNADDPIIADIRMRLKESAEEATKMRDYNRIEEAFLSDEYVEAEQVISDPADGSITVTCSAKDGLYFKVLSRQCGNDVNDEFTLMSFVKKLARSYAEYEGIRRAMTGVKESGYGVVNPSVEDMELAEPEMVKKGNQYGVRLKASAPSYHIVRVDVESEISPTIGTEQQSDDLLKSLLSDFENDKQAIWDTNMFGKTLRSVVKDDLSNKLNGMPLDAQNKLRRTIQRIVNEGKGGVLCILL